jgi:hypothetical protein
MRIAEAVARGDGPAAAAEAAAHVEMVGLLVLQTFLEGSEPDASTYTD